MGWLTAEKRDQLQEGAFELAMDAKSRGDVKDFVVLAKFCESGYQSDLRQQERESSVDRTQQRVVINAEIVTVENLEQQRQKLLERVRAIGD